jgi:hypothetical protein
LTYYFAFIAVVSRRWKILESKLCSLVFSGVNSIEQDAKRHAKFYIYIEKFIEIPQVMTAIGAS